MTTIVFLSGKPSASIKVNRLTILDKMSLVNISIFTEVNLQAWREDKPLNEVHDYLNSICLPSSHSCH